MAELRVCGICGSLRSGSYNRALLRAAAELAPAGVRIDGFDRLREIPPYDQDVDAAGAPEPVGALRRAISQADALLVATPELNYSVPGVLKNALDWASRPLGDSPLRHKFVVLMGASMGLSGTVRAQLALRQIFLSTDSYVLQRPEVLVTRAQEKFDASLRLIDETSRALVRQALEALPSWVARAR